MNARKNSRDRRREAADMQLLDSLLRQAMRPEQEAREARVQRVLQHLDDPDGHGVENDPGLSRKKPSPRRWVSVAIAASVVLGIGLVWQASIPSRQAYALVADTLQRAVETGARHYRITANVQRPMVGPKDVVAELYVDGSERFLLRHPAILMFGETWIGRNEQECWIIPTHGPTLIGDEEMLRQWMSDQQELSTPYLHITTILDRMSDDYTLEIQSAESLDLQGRSRLCQRVRGTLRSPSRSLPQTIELWADADSGVAVQLILDWDLQPGQFGRSRVTLQLQPAPQLPGDWFTPTRRQSENAAAHVDDQVHR